MNSGTLFVCSEHLLLPGRLQNFFFPMDLGHLRGVLHQIFVTFLVPMEKMFKDDSLRLVPTCIFSAVRTRFLS